MIATERHDIAAAYIQRIRELVGGKRIMPEVNYGERDNVTTHLSDVASGSCIAIPYYRKMAIKQGLAEPEINDDSALFFLRGRVIERVIGSEMAPRVCEGVTFTLDDFHPEYGYAEIKSTASDMSRFQPETMYEHWRSRILGYCHALDICAMNLVVMFLVGNTASHKWAKPGRKTVGLRAWALSFTPDEIQKNWDDILYRKDELEGSIRDDRPLDPLMVTPQGYECASCVHQPICQYYSGGK